MILFGVTGVLTKNFLANNFNNAFFLGKGLDNRTGTRVKSCSLSELLKRADDERVTHVAFIIGSAVLKNKLADLECDFGVFNSNSEITYSVEDGFNCIGFIVKKELICKKCKTIEQIFAQVFSEQLYFKQINSFIGRSAFFEDLNKLQKYLNSYGIISNTESDDVDLVIPWVNSLDYEWRKEVIKYSKVPIDIDSSERFQDTGLFKYALRSWAENAPWIRKLHLILSSESQIPEWLNTDEVDVVLHNEIIPEDKLPVFNSCAIEAGLCNLTSDRVANKILYVNDDEFLIQPADKSRWFKEYTGVSYTSENFLADSKLRAAPDESTQIHRKIQSNDVEVLADMYIKKMGSIMNSYELSRIKEPAHAAVPLFLKDLQFFRNEINNSELFNRFRSSSDINRNLFYAWSAYQSKYEILPKDDSIRYLCLHKRAAHYIARMLETKVYVNKGVYSICLNDFDITQKELQVIQDALMSLYPNKCRFEK